MNQTHNILTQDELLHLAIEATRRGEHGAAISYLKEGVSRFPEDGKLAYVLGAEFAQIGLYDKAESEMARAIELAPELHTASFQLGLLQMTMGKVTEAKASWAKLDVLPERHALYLFKTGLEHLAAEQYGEARRLLDQGIAANDFSPELTRDMENVMAGLPEAVETAVANSADVTASESGHVWLSAYNNTDKPN
ncbi:tetratricopeptide repeat protein [Pseudomethylobacillus aquaticus]|nr:tetratricopeptide repeat protein [Pseudomethylobacillus aquaticus]